MAGNCAKVQPFAYVTFVSLITNIEIMMKNFALFLALVSVFALWGQAIQAQFGSLDVEESTVPVVVELYTSQSCSSCPPADKILHDLSQQKNIIALSCHVTYWNYLHWKDTQSQEFCTERQRAFANARGTGRVYTPQMVINAETEFVGSRKGEASSVINRAIREEKVKPITISKDDNKLSFDLPNVAPGKYGVWVFGYKDKHTQNIPSGENKGKTVTYVNSAQHQHFAGDWDGTAVSMDVDIPQNVDIDGFVVIAQSEKYGPVVAAGQSGS